MGKARDERFVPDGYVYVLGGRGYYKIGRTKEIDKRVKELGILLPWSVGVEHTIPCQDHKAAEKALHDMFAHHRAHGEWFSLGESELENIKNIERMRGTAIEWSGDNPFSRLDLDQESTPED